ncbi:MAG: hypothetical protein H0W72_15525 [Planctomycetes bacterium]|nr:hypothetical protein [Planctomycetota bacterium]
MRPILIVGGAPRVRVDAVRDLIAQGTGATAVALAQRLAAAGIVPDLLLSDDAVPGDARRYRDRADLEQALGDWIAGHRNGVVVLSAAINDYEVATIDRRSGASWSRMAPSDKFPSGADEVLIRLQPAAKVVDQLRPRWGLSGPIVAFKFEGRDTVVASAERLRSRVGAALVVANSLCGGVQALVTEQGVEALPDRPALLERLAVAVLALATS